MIYLLPQPGRWWRKRSMLDEKEHVMTITEYHERIMNIWRRRGYDPANPCTHYAFVGREYLIRGLDLRDLDEDPETDEESDDLIPAKRQRAIDMRVLQMIRGEPMRQPWTRKADEQSDKKQAKASKELKEKEVELAGLRIDWHIAVPGLRTWAGQASLDAIIKNRRAAIQAAGDLPEGESIIEWEVPLRRGQGTSGIDHTSALSNQDIGFSPREVGMAICVRAAAELLAVIGMQISPIVKLGPRTYGYQDLALNDWWTFDIGPITSGNPYYRRWNPARQYYLQGERLMISDGCCT